MAVLDFSVATAYVYAQDIDVLEISGLYAGSSYRLYMSIKRSNTVIDTIDNLYTADKSGVIYLTDMARLFNSYIMSYVSMSSATTNMAMELQVTFTLAGSKSCTRNILYSRRRLNVSAPATYYILPTLLRYKYTTTDRHERIYVPSYYTGSKSLQVSLAYLYNGAAFYKTATISVSSSTTDDYMYADVSLSTVLTKVAAVAGLSASVMTPLYYNVDLYIDSVLKDEIHYDVDNDNHIQSSSFIYLNIFGLPQTLTFTGLDTEQLEYEAEFGYCSKNYRALDKTLIPKHEVNTGWLSKEMKSAVRELIDSPYVAVYKKTSSGLSLVEITITDVDWSTVSPSNEPDNVKITYRIADQDNDDLLLETMTDQNSIFAKPPFDQSFD